MGQIFASDRGVPHFNALAGAIPCQYRHKWYIAKTYILWPTFPLQKVLMYLQPRSRNQSRKLPNSVKLRCGEGYITSFEVIQCHRVCYHHGSVSDLPASRQLMDVYRATDWVLLPDGLSLWQAHWSGTHCQSIWETLPSAKTVSGNS